MEKVYFEVYFNLKVQALLSGPENLMLLNVFLRAMLRIFSLELAIVKPLC